MPVLKSKGKTCIVEEPSHVKQLSLNHVGKIGLITKCIKIFLKLILKLLSDDS